jgi:hypothetical protein
MSTEEKKENLSYLERTLAQVAVVDKLTAQAAESKDPGTLKQLEIEVEKLAFYENAAKGDPRSRAALAVERARATLLGRAVTQPLPPLI